MQEMLVKTLYTALILMKMQQLKVHSTLQGLKNSENDPEEYK